MCGEEILTNVAIEANREMMQNLMETEKSMNHLKLKQNNY